MALILSASPQCNKPLHQLPIQSERLGLMALIIVPAIGRRSASLCRQAEAPMFAAAQGCRPLMATRDARGVSLSEVAGKMTEAGLIIFGNPG